MRGGAKRASGRGAARGAIGGRIARVYESQENATWGFLSDNNYPLAKPPYMIRISVIFCRIMLG